MLKYLKQKQSYTFDAVDKYSKLQTSEILGQLPAVVGLPRDLYFPMLTNSPPSLFLTPSSCGITMTQALWDPVVSMCPGKYIEHIHFPKNE